MATNKKQPALKKKVHKPVKVSYDANLDTSKVKKAVHDLLDKNDCCERAPDNYDRDAELMKSAARHIRGLQDTTRIQANRLDMFDKCYNLFTGNNRQNGGDCCGQDIAYSLERRAEERVEELKSSKPQS